MKFFYKAKKKTAETVTGSIFAQNEMEAIELIHQLGLTPVEVKPETIEVKFEDFDANKKVRHKDLYFFTKQLANLLKSGVTLLRGISLIEEQIQDKYFKTVIFNVFEQVKNGKPLSSALAKFPKIFSSMYIAMIHAGEESGNIFESLMNLAVYQKKQRDIHSKIRAALAYPLFMTTVGIATIYYIIAFVFPRMAVLFESLESIPKPTLIMIEVSHFLSQNWLGLLCVFTAVIFGMRLFQNSKKGKSFLSNFILKIPFVGEIVLKSELGRFASTIVMLTKSGVSLTRSLDITIPILSNELVKTQLYGAKEHLLSGGSLGESIQELKNFPVMMGHLISVGEESDSLEDVFSEIAETYEQETEEKIKIFTALFEPMMILFIGLIIGFIVFAMLLPIFEMDLMMH